MVNDECNILRVDSVSSTNDFLKELMLERCLDECFAVYSPKQTAGRGQRGNSWESEVGRNIAFSMVFYPDFLTAGRGFLLSEVVALGVRDALERLLCGIEIKFPNDIYFNDGKLGGILLENEITGEVIVSSIAGTGLNVNQEVFRSGAPNPVSMKQILGREVEIEPLLESIICCIRRRYVRLKDGDAGSVIRDFHDALYRKSGFFRYCDRNGCFVAETVRVSDDGILHLRTDCGEERMYAFKEVVFI
jgi:BirA family biotin operon repressor/biotin-[acetyl-CoA-carboxylase] ligase